MQRILRPLALLLGLTLGCVEADSPYDTLEEPTSMSSEPGAAVGVTRCDGRAIQDQAQDLVQEAAACQEDKECALTELDGECLSAFVCSVPVNKNANLVNLRAEAARLSAEYKQCSNVSCVQASCAGPFGAKCDQSTGVCTRVEL